jgi:hypothetical protein
MKYDTNTTSPIGVVVYGVDANDFSLTAQQITSALGVPGLAAHTAIARNTNDRGAHLQLSLCKEQAHQWAANCNTLQLSQSLQDWGSDVAAKLTYEIVAAMLLAPHALEFPSLQELYASVRIRHNIASAASKTSLAFDTSQAERPEDCWSYNEDHGFVIRPTANLIPSLIKATQPEVSGIQYTFSCYRATEYVIVLGIAQELATSNTELFEQLEGIWRQRPIRSGQFHDVFLREWGSMEQPIPPLYFVPGDRVWFRNPDEASSDASGYEGSWVIYLGRGQFCNFWKYDQPYTLQSKCVEMYFWREGLYRDNAGEARINETKIAPYIQEALSNPSQLEHIMSIMARYREPRGVYTAAGGCLDTSREFARWVCPATCDLKLPTI